MTMRRPNAVWLWFTDQAPWPSIQSPQVRVTKEKLPPKPRLNLMPEGSKYKRATLPEEPFKADIAVVTVHGIGRIKKGEMAQNFAMGLAYTTRGWPYIPHIGPENQREPDPNGVIQLDAGERKLVFLDAHWEPLIEPREHFQLRWLLNTPWYPLINASKPAWHPSCWKKLIAGLCLMGLGVVVLLLFQAGTLIGALIVPFRRVQAKSQDIPDAMDIQSARCWVNTKAARLADVFVYVESVLHGGSISQDIERALESELARASELASKLVVVGHSLGTVIAYRCITKAQAQSTSPEWLDKIESLITLGCPLQKVRYFWPNAIPVNQSTLDLKRPPFRWKNITDPLDIISDQLHEFDQQSAYVENVHVWGLCGPLRAHSRKLYQNHPRFRTEMGLGILYRFYPVPRPIWSRVMGSVQTLIETAMAVMLLVIGVALGLIATLGPLLFFWPELRDLGNWQPFIPALVLLSGIFCWTFYRDAKKAHIDSTGAG